MSTLEFRGSRKTGYKTLCRRHHGPGGVDYEYIGSLPDNTAQAIQDGGALRLRLREDANPDQACWCLDVTLRGEVFEGALLSNYGYGVLMQEEDRIPVHIEGGELTLRKHELLFARHALERAEAVARTASARVSTLEREIITMTSDQTLLRLATADGKYEVVRTTGGEAYATRNGERWRDLTDAPLTLAIAQELHGTRAAISALGGDPLESGETPSSYGEARDMLRLTLKDGGEVVQDAQGRFSGTMDGVPVPGLTGDKLTLSLAYELEGARAALDTITLTQPASTSEVADDPAP
jgi:hypothetical protein